MHELQEQLTSADFSELAAYIRRNTSNPDMWWSQAVQTSNIVNAMSGEWIPPENFVPGQVDIEAQREQRMKLAEERMDRAAQKEN